MGKMLMVSAVALAILVGGSSAGAKTEGIEITKSGFNDTTVSIVSGDAVAWKNMDTAEHEVVVDKTTCKLALQPGQTGSCTFSTPGTFTFKDPTVKGNASGFAGLIATWRHSSTPNRSSAAFT